MNNIVKKFKPSEKGNKIRGLRESKGWSQTRLAQESRVSRATIQNIETGKHSPLDKTLGQIFSALEGKETQSAPETKENGSEHLGEIREEKGDYLAEILNSLKDDPQAAKVVFHFLEAKNNFDRASKSMKQYLGKKMETCFELPSGSDEKNKREGDQS
jgi:transcriptional regulator with XRE-family HTH domain